MPAGANPFAPSKSSAGGSNPFLGGSSGTGSKSNPFLGGAPPLHGSGGLLGFVEHLGSDTAHAITGLGPGVADALKTTYEQTASRIAGNSKQQQAADTHAADVVSGIGKSYAQEYGPLLHGDVGSFAHNLYEHPLGPLLDAATIATLGAGGVAKAGSILAKAGAISDTSKLAQLGGSIDLTVPDFAKGAGQPGEDIVVKQSSANPLIRGRQQLVNEALKKLPENTPMVGSSTRAVKALSRQPERAAARLSIQAAPFEQAFAKLAPEEKAAWHLSARAVTPDQYRGFLESQGPGAASPAMLKLLSDPKVAQLVDNPTPALTDALAKGRALSDQLTALKLNAAHISDQAAAESPYRLLRMINGAKIVPAEQAASSAALKTAVAERDRLAGLHATALERQATWHEINRGLFTPGGEPVLGTPHASDPYRNAVVKLGHAVDVAHERVDKLTPAATAQAGIVDQPGREIDALAKELAATGREQPFYVPDSAVVTRNRFGRFTSRPTGFAEPAMSGASKQNLGVLASRGMLAFHENPLAYEFGRFGRYTEASMLHDELVKHAAELSKGTPLPQGLEYLKVNRGEAAAPYTERAGAEFEHALDPGTADRLLTRDNASKEIATSAAGNRLVVPSSVRRILEDKSLSYHGALHRLLFDLPTSVWKHLVLGLRPAFFGNITVGNSVLGALQMAPGLHGPAGWLNQVVPGAERLLGSKLTPETMAEVLPEQAMATFGHSVGMSRGAVRGSSKVTRAASRAYQGVMPATIAYENVLRRAMAEGWAKASPEVQQVMLGNGGDVNAALRQVAQTHPQVIDNISKRIDDALGNYRRYSRFERAIKGPIPFYGWDRHIVRSAARIALERPGRLDALRALGTEGNQQQDATLGPLPSYMHGDIRLPGLPGFLGPLDGRTPVLQTRSLNPFSTLVELGAIPQAIVGKPGKGAEELGNLNPLIQAMLEQLTGRSTLTGAPLKQNAFLGMVENLPQVSPILTALGKGAPTKPTSLYKHDAATKLANLLGIPIKKVALQTAHHYATTGG